MKADKQYIIQKALVVSICICLADSGEGLDRSALFARGRPRLSFISTIANHEWRSSSSQDEAGECCDEADLLLLYRNLSSVLHTSYYRVFGTILSGRTDFSRFLQGPTERVEICVAAQNASLNAVWTSNVPLSSVDRSPFISFLRLPPAIVCPQAVRIRFSRRDDTDHGVDDDLDGR